MSLSSSPRSVTYQCRLDRYSCHWKRPTSRHYWKKLNSDKGDITNYRPISNLSVLSKLLERVISKQLIAYLDTNGLFPMYQSVYRTAHLTETTLTVVFSALIQEMDAGNITLLSLLDLSAAFDCVDHEIFFNQLQITDDLESTVINWFVSYLSDRIQSVHHDGRFSARSTMPFGVSQGSVLGPLMFLLHTSDIEKLIAHRELSPHLFADDTQMLIFCHPGNTLLIRYTTLSCNSNIEKWMCSNRLKLNPAKKTEFLWCATHWRLHFIDEARP